MKSQSNIFKDNCNFDTRKSLNKSTEVISTELCQKIEKDGITLEELEQLTIPVYKYITQITLHGIFDVSMNRLGDYNNLILNGNKSLGIKYNGIDIQKKELINKILTYYQKTKPDRYFTFYNDSRGTQIQIKVPVDEIDCDDIKDKLKLMLDDINCFIGSKEIHYLHIYGTFYCCATINLKAIYENDLYLFISKLTDNVITTEQDYLTIKEQVDKQIKEEQIIQAKLDAENKDLQLLIKSNPYTKILTKLPDSTEYSICTITKDYKDRPAIKLIYVYNSTHYRSANFYSFEAMPNKLKRETKQRLPQVFSKLNIPNEIENGVKYYVVKDYDNKEATEINEINLYLELSDYKNAILLKGNTRPIKYKLRNMNGLWNDYLSGWIFPKYRREELITEFPMIKEV